MINSKKIIIIISFLLLLSCGYKPIFSSKKADFSITEIKLLGDIKIGSKIKKNLNIYKNAENKSIFYSLEINSDQKKNVVSKDAKGDPKIFEIQVLIDLTILENNKVKNKKNFKESFSYNNSTNKFSLTQYEKNIKDNLIKKIVAKIIIYLYSI
tara:strand:+ start:187 stop:648 length:462 start_codon:yes stop_codon:yes gene_type:complete